MLSQSHFKGKIFEYTLKDKKKVLMNYQTKSFQLEFNHSFITSFDQYNFTAEEKKKLSRSYRHELICYKKINLFELKTNALKLCEFINSTNKEKLIIEAHDYGAYICLAALFSGKINPNIEVQFLLEKSPIALFPHGLIKKNPAKKHSVAYNNTTEFWVNHFQTLFINNLPKVKLQKAA